MLLDNLKAVLLAQKKYTKKKGGDGYQYSFVVKGEIMNVTGDVDLSHDVSNLEKEQLNVGLLAVELLEFKSDKGSQSYYKLVTFNV